MVLLALPTGSGAALVVCVLLGCAVVVGLVLARNRRRERDLQSRLAAELARSRAEVDALARRVEELGREVVDARRSTAPAVRGGDREYLITSLMAPGDFAVAPARSTRRPVGKDVEARLVRTLAQVGEESRARTRAVGLAVRTVALAHGVRRMLSPEVLDRAAAEAQVARRRSRRERRRELREARRLLRSVRYVEADGVPDPSASRDAAGRREDAA